MNKMGLWFLMSCKRQLKRPFFLILLILIPVGMGCFRQLEKNDSGRIAIALYSDGDAWNEKVTEALTGGGHSFAFYVCESKEELLEDVAAKRAECGYVFPSGLKKMLDRGEYRRKISMVVSPSTVAAQLASEAVFAGLFKVYGRDLLKQYAETGELFAPLAAAGEGAVWSELEPLYDQYLENGSTFAFQYGTASGGRMEENTIKAVFPVRGIAAVFILVIGLSAAVTAAADEKKGLFQSMAGIRRTTCILVQMAAPILLSCLSAFLCLVSSGELGPMGTETAALLAYAAAVTLFSCLLERVIKNPLFLSGLIPFFIIGSLVACPVFADLSAFVPILKTVRLLFLPYYYLMV